MTLFGSSRAFVGLDIGTSSLKLVELLDRRKRREVTTYAEADMPNSIIDPPGSVDEALRLTANTISRMMDSAQVSTDTVIAALPSSSVFSTVLTLPNLPEADMDQAVHFAARDVIPANLNEMVLGWNRLGEQPHMDGPQKSTVSPAGPSVSSPASSSILSPETIPVFVTAAPKMIVERYSRLAQLLNVRLHALEVETFPLVRSLLASPTESAVIIDLGDLATTFHVIDRGTPRVSHTIDYGGHDITGALAQQLTISTEEAEKKKSQNGLQGEARIRDSISAALNEISEQARQVVSRYSEQQRTVIKKTIVIGGGANLPGLATYWSQKLGQTVSIGNPWRGLSYPGHLEKQVQYLGPKYAVAVGLALRGFI